MKRIVFIISVFFCLFLQGQVINLGQNLNRGIGNVIDLGATSADTLRIACDSILDCNQILPRNTMFSDADAYEIKQSILNVIDDYFKHEELT